MGLAEESGAMDENLSGLPKSWSVGGNRTTLTVLSEMSRDSLKVSPTLRWPRKTLPSSSSSHLMFSSLRKSLFSKER